VSTDIISKHYALDAALSLPGSAKKSAVEKAMTGHVIAKGSLMELTRVGTDQFHFSAKMPLAGRS